ncbi:MAG: HAD hydrolase family protein [Polyangiaceae bacterium]|nr:HAD hydrolase family protein [Polyangiaceae bacterium]
MVRTLPQVQLSERARRIRLLVSDVDGVLTPAQVYYSERGEELKRFSLRDGMGTELLRVAGIETAYFTRENCPIALRRAQKLKLAHLWLGVHDKARALPELLLSARYRLGEVAYMGDDVNDLEAMELVGEVGLTGAPSDAVASVLAAAHKVTAKSGGQGCFREFADWILATRQEA